MSMVQFQAAKKHLNEAEVNPRKTTALEQRRQFVEIVEVRMLLTLHHTTNGSIDLYLICNQMRAFLALGTFIPTAPKLDNHLQPTVGNDARYSNNPRCDILGPCEKKSP